MTKINSPIVDHIAKLAKIPLSEDEKDNFATGFTKTLEVVDKLFKVDVSDIEPTHQVAGLKNILREDKVNEEKMLPQKKALSNTKNQHDGYFVVDQILAED